MRSDLTDLLGQVVLADRLSAELSKPGARQWLRGPSGSGKTTVIGLVAERLKSTCKVIRLTGDAGHAGTKFLAFHRALAGTRMRKSVRDAIETGFVAPLKVIPIVGGAAADLAKIAAAGIGAPKPEFLTAEQQDILQGLQHVAGGDHLIIMIDDVSWLDSDSANILLLLTKAELERAFPFARDASLLFVETSDLPAVLPTTVLTKLRPSRIVERQAVEPRQFRAVLEAFGLKRRLDDRLLEELYAISQGHLEIAKQIVKLDQGADLASLLARGDAAELMAELLMSRLARLDGESALRRLLSLAACVERRAKRTPLAG